MIALSGPASWWTETRLVMAGEIHYFRVDRAEWEDRLDKLVEVGCTCVAAYIPWLFDELPDGSIDVTGRTRPERDLGAFIDCVPNVGLPSSPGRARS